MMSLKERLNNDLKNAMKNNDIFLRDTIRLINSAIKQVEVDKRISLKDEDIIKILNSAKKQRLDSINAYKNASRDDLVQKEQKELDIILSYLPKQLDDNELESKIKEIIASINATSIKDLGKVMNEAKSLSQVADGARISKIAKELLANAT